jgi:hypothetical protein
MTIEYVIVFETRGRKKKYNTEERKERKRKQNLLWQKKNKEKYNECKRKYYHNNKKIDKVDIILEY